MGLIEAGFIGMGNGVSYPVCIQQQVEDAGPLENLQDRLINQRIVFKTLTSSRDFNLLWSNLGQPHVLWRSVNQTLRKPFHIKSSEDVIDYAPFMYAYGGFLHDIRGSFGRQSRSVVAESLSVIGENRPYVGLVVKQDENLYQARRRFFMQAKRFLQSLGITDLALFFQDAPMLQRELNPETSPRISLGSLDRTAVLPHINVGGMAISVSAPTIANVTFEPRKNT